MNILVTGSSGLIGRELCKQLIAQDHKVYGVDLNDAVVYHKNYTHSNYIWNVKYDKIFHFMGFPCPEHYLQRSATTIDDTLRAFNYTIQWALKYNAELIVASSSEVYADEGTNQDMQEDSIGTIPLEHPRSCYKELKRMLEVMTHAYRRQYGIKTKIVRVFNSYGECNFGDTRFINQLIKCAKSDTAFKLYGDGEQRRSYCHVEDTVRGILTLSDNDVYEPVNIGNPFEEYSVNEVIEIFESIIEKKIKKQFVDNKNMIGPLYRKPEIKKIQKLGWNPKITLKEGLSRLISSIST